MSASGVTLLVSGDGSSAACAALHREIWELALAYIRKLAVSDANAAVLAFGASVPQTGTREWGATGNALHFWFNDDFHGQVWTHWLELALAANWQELQTLAQELELELTANHTISSLASDAHWQRWHLVEYAEALWIAEHDQLRNQQHVLGLTSPESRHVYAKAMRTCQCSVCRFLRPDPAIEAALRAQLQDVELAPSVIWYLKQATHPAVETLDAAIAAGAEVQPRMLLELIEHIAAHHDTWLRYADRIEGFAAGERSLALAALAPCVTAARRTQYVAMLRDALVPYSTCSDVVIELLTKFRDDAHWFEEQLVHLLNGTQRNSDDTAEMQHSAVLALANLHLPHVRLAPPTHAALATVADQPTQAGKLATWLISLAAPRLSA